jgi:alkylation response protein AidB-like acyl-CoA dehydrogenase
MDFTLNADQQMIRTAADEFLAEQSDSAKVRRVLAECGGHDAPLWRAMREDMGWCGVAIPEALGGMGLGQVERALLMEQMGRRLACVPYLASACLAVDALLHVAIPQAQQRYLPRLADGTLCAALALPASLGWQPGACKISALREGDAYVLNGSAQQVLGAAEAELLLVPARLVDQPDTFGLFAVDAAALGLQVAALPTLDATRRIACVELRQVRVRADQRIDTAGWSEELHEGLRRTGDLAALALAAEQIGSAQQCLDLTLAYVNERTQFGRPVASFQAVKHRCAQMMVALEAARSTVYGAAHAAAEKLNTDRLALDVACAKAAANQALFFCAQEAIQLHGGVGFTWEYDPHLYFKRAQAARTWFGDDDECHARIAAHLCDAADEPHALSEKRDDSDSDTAFRNDIAQWMAEHLQGEFAPLRHRGGPGDEDAFPQQRKAWERVLADGGWTCVGWPKEHGGRALSIAQQVIFHEEYARAGGPGRMGHIGEGLIGPTLIAYGTEDQKRRFLPGIRDGSTFWCQGYSEPNAGSDLANVQTRAEQDAASGDWIVNGQKVWTSLAHESDWIFVLARCDAGSRGNRGLIFLLMPLHQPGVEIRPIRQISGSAEFNEVFFDGARAKAVDVVGQPSDGWKIAMALLGFERGLSTLGQQMHFRHELDMVIAAARTNGALRNPAIKRRLAQAWAGLRTMRYNALRMLSGDSDGQLRGESLIYKYYWSNWHRMLGELAMDVLGTDGNLLGADDARRARLQGLFLFSRADTIYAGTNEIQLNIIAERGLGMPKEARGQA